MSHRILLAALIVPALSSVALAQGAPGSCDDCYAAPAPVVLVQGPEIDPSNRLGVGLHVASLAIANRDDPDADPTELGGGGIQVRYRLTPRWELELGLAMFRQHDDDGMPTGPEVHTGTVGALFHMRPGRRWDWYLVGAIGGVHVGEHGERAHDDEGRAMAQLGIGIERRWNHFGLGLDLRAVGIAPAADAKDDVLPAGQPTTSGRAPGTQTPPPPPTDDREDEGDHGAQLTFGATYYF